MRIYNDITELIGGTPLVYIPQCAEELGAGDARIAVKLESFNPTGSAKDRAAMAMIVEAEGHGHLAPGGTIIEPTSGNTGIGLAAIAASRGYRMIVVLPDTMSVERRRLIEVYGAELVLTPGPEGMAGAIKKAEELKASTPNSIIAGQFDNHANPAAHYISTGPEIWRDTDGEVDIFVATVGTGGTITGAGLYLKSEKPEVRVVAVEPSGSPVLSGGEAGPHAIQGIGAGFVPHVLDKGAYDEVVTVSDGEAKDAALTLARTEGLLTGLSSGAALSAAVKLAKRPENAGKLIVALLPDTGERYLSVL